MLSGSISIPCTNLRSPPRQRTFPFAIGMSKMFIDCIEWQDLNPNRLHDSARMLVAI